MKLSHRVRRLERAEDATGGSCICMPATCDVHRPDPPYSDCYPDRPNVTCPRCGRTAPRIVVIDKRATIPRNDADAGSSW